MSEANRCAECGGELAADAPLGLCPGCLMKRGLETNTFPTGGGASASADYVPPTPAELAAYFPDLEILELIGRGGMGVVYKARQKRLDRLVALKILSPKIGQDPAFAERFAREARAMAMLSHPHIVTVHDFGCTRSEGVSPAGESASATPAAANAGGTPALPSNDGGLYYFIMEFVDGVNLRRLLDTQKLSPEQALAIVPQICDALQFAHNSGVVHRDIKPENILLDKNGQVKIADFGLAKLMRSSEKLDSPRTPPHCNGGDLEAARHDSPNLTAAGQVMGTPNYMAPEQFEHPQDVDHRADIYSLGVVFYQMLTGELPIGRFAPPSKKVHIDVRLDEVVLRALEKEPERRYQEADELKTRIETIVTTPATLHGTKSADVPPISPKTPRRVADVVAMLFGSPFTSPVARTICNMSALGFLGFLACLGFVPIPGMHRCFGFSGFFGFFGLIGVAVLVEIVARRKAKNRIEELATPSSPSPDNADIEAARRQVQAPAIGLLIVGILNWLATPRIVLFVLVAGVRFTGQHVAGPHTEPKILPVLLILAAIAFVPALLSTLMIVAALKMKRLRAYGLAVAASIFAIFSPACLVGLPIGIWALVVLSQRDVREAFRRQRLAKRAAVIDAFNTSDKARKPQRSQMGVVALVLALAGPLLGIALADTSILLAMAASLGAELAALILGILAWKSTTGKAAAVVVVLLSVTTYVMFAIAKENAYRSRQGTTLADLPFELAKRSTAEVIQAGLSKPTAPWAWQELAKRNLTQADSDQILDGLTAWLQHNYPNGYDGSLNWLCTFLKSLAEKGLVSDAQAIRFLQALHGRLQCDPGLRIREGQAALSLHCRWKEPWDDGLFGLMLLNEMRAVTIDGRPVTSDRQYPKFWNWNDFNGDLSLPKLAPGEHIIKLEVLSALVPKDDLAGLANDAPSTDWPPAKCRWTRTAQTKLVVYPRGAVMVAETLDPGLDPVAAGGLSLKRVIVRKQGQRTEAVIAFDVNNKLPVSISFDVALRAGGKAIPCGGDCSLWAAKRADGQICSASGTDLTKTIEPLPSDIKEADVILTPNPQPVETVAGIDRIWGKTVVFSRVPLVRQDSAKSSGMPTTTGDQPGGAWTATLPEGNVKLVAITRHPSSGQLWWKPDDSAYSEHPFDISNSFQVNDKTRAVWTFVFRLPNDSSSLYISKTTPASGSSGSRVPTSNGQPLSEYRYAFAALPCEAGTVTLDVAVAAGTWMTLHSHPATAGAGIVVGGVENKTVEVSIAKAIETADGNVVVNASVNGLTDCEFRVVAVDQQGQEHTPTGGESSTINNLLQLTPTFAKLPLKQIKEFRLQKRPYRHVEFHNVSLHPIEAPPTKTTSKDVVFGPVIERVVNDCRENPTDSAINIDSGELFSVPNDLRPNRLPNPKSQPIFVPNDPLPNRLPTPESVWVRDRGIDAAGYVGVVTAITRGNAKPVKTVYAGLVAQEMKAVVADNSEWDHLTAANVRGLWANSRLMPSAKAMQIAGEFPSTRVFRTREGGMGILQILGFTGSVDKPVGVKIRYRLVKEATPPSLATDNDPARLKLESAERLFKMKVELDRNLAAAELKGDVVESARAKLRYTQQRLDFVLAEHDRGLTTAEVVEKAKRARYVAAMAVKKLEELNAAKIEPSKPAAAQHDTETTRAKLESAERVYKVVEARHKTGGATEVELLKAALARDAAAAELRGDAVSMARVKLRYADEILKKIKALYEHGAVGGEFETYEEARLNRDLAAAELKKLEASNPAKTEPGKLAPVTSAPPKARLADAIKTFNARAALDPVGKNQPPLTEDEVIAAIRWALLDANKLLVSDATRRALGEVVNSRELPREFEFEVLTAFEPDDRMEVTKWSVRLRIPALSYGTTCVSIREQPIRSRLFGEEERKVIARWRLKWQQEGGVTSSDEQECADERAKAAELDRSKQKTHGQQKEKSSTSSKTLRTPSPVKPHGPVLTYEAEPRSKRPQQANQSMAEQFRAARQELTDLIRAVDHRVNSGPEKVALVRGNSTPLGLQIDVELLNRDDSARQRVERLLLHPGNLEFRILANTHDNKDLIDRVMKEPKKSEVLDPAGKRLAWWAPVKAGNERIFTTYGDVARRTREKGDEETTEVLVLADPYNVTGKYLTQAKAGVDSAGKPCVEFSLNTAGAKRFSKLTGEHLPDKSGRHTCKLGIIFDGELQSAPSIQSVISSSGQITGVFTKQDVADIADILNSGSLPMRLRLVNP